MMEFVFVSDYKVRVSSALEAKKLVQEIFKEHCYYFETDNRSPVIIDAGAHVGLASLYFKKIYPEARVVAVEPVAEVVKMLRENLYENQVQGVDVVEAALGNRQRNTSFYLDGSGDEWWSTAGFYEGAWNGKQKSVRREVPVINLSELLIGKIDFLKMDIEGVELEVLKEASAKLKFVQELVVEFHPIGGRKVEELKLILEQAGFRVTSEFIQKKGINKGLERVRGER